MNQEINPYAPPAAADEAPAPKVAEGGQFYAVTPLKMVLLYVATFGIYSTYWLYRQWKAVREQTRENISPFWRAIFDIFFVGRLFTHLRAHTVDAGVAARGSTGALVALFIIAEILGRIGSRMESNVVWLVGFVAVAPIVVLQREINESLERTSPGFDRNAGYGAGTIVLLVLGLGLWALILIGILVPDTP
jgi:hypothetical protein